VVTGSAEQCAAIVTRSGDAGKALAKLIQDQSIRSWYMPTLAIKSLEILLPIEDFQQAIFVSANAVKYSVDMNSTMADMLPDELIAVGPGTASLLQDAGFTTELPVTFNSEGLLKLPQLQQVKGQHILVVKGRGGRSLLQDTLIKRGAICHSLDVYCRVACQFDEQAWSQFEDFSGKKFVVFASIEGMDELNKHIDYNQLQSLTAVVASERIAEAAKRFGYPEIIVAKSAANEAMLDVLLSATSLNI
jgi:uroporphyrinogen-III synthase